MDNEHDKVVEDMLQELRRGEKRRQKQPSLKECLEKIGGKEENRLPVAATNSNRSC